MTRGIRIAARCEAVLLGLLTVTGLYLNWFYRPSSVRVYFFGDTKGPQTSIRVAHGIRALHVVCSIGFVWVGVGLAGMCIAGAFRGTRVQSRATTAAVGGFTVLAFGASFTGHLLPWDQLALRAVTVGSNMRGLWQAAFSDQIRFVLIGNREISQGTLRGWFLVHAFVLPPLLAATFIVSFFRKAGSGEADV
ncbi:MAG: menaquinol-cytochrome c reductase cytochrome b subunit [Actinomycetota bacterium]